jgi:chromate transporter
MIRRVGDGTPGRTGREQAAGAAPAARNAPPPPSLAEIVRQWGRIGCIGFGGPPAHIALLRELCVTRRRWLSDTDFERALAAVNVLPGPASTQLSIYCAWRLRGYRGAVLGGVCFILPGLILILALSALFLAGSPPRWVRGAGMGAGAAVAAVAVRAGLDIAVPIWARTRGRRRLHVLAYALAGAIAAAITGPWLVIVLLACGAVELMAARGRAPLRLNAGAWPLLAGAVADPAGLPALLWMALKIGALAFGGGFVIVPLMQADAVGAHHWMTHGQFLDAVALGQVTPGPLVQTVAAVGYAAGGLGWGLLAALVAFLPSFSFVLLGAARFERLLGDGRALTFLAGAAPAAAGAIVGAAIPLTEALGRTWQYPLLVAAAVALLLARLPIVPVLLASGAVGVLAALLGAPLLR